MNAVASRLFGCCIGSGLRLKCCFSMLMYVTNRCLKKWKCFGFFSSLPCIRTTVEGSSFVERQEPLRNNVPNETQPEPANGNGNKE